MTVGADCWYECGYKGGPCNFCGAGGLCCKMGQYELGGRCDGTVGGKDKHECFPNLVGK